MITKKRLIKFVSLFVCLFFCICFFSSFLKPRNAFADELYPGDDTLFNSDCNYLFDIDTVILDCGSDIAIDYPSPIYPDKLLWYYENGYGSYVNRRAFGYTIGSVVYDQSPEFDIFFGAGSDNVYPQYSYDLFRQDWATPYHVDLYKSNSYIRLQDKGFKNKLKIIFDDSFLSLGYDEGARLSNSFLNSKGFYLYFIGDDSFTMNVIVNYQYYYNYDLPYHSIEPMPPDLRSQFILSEPLTHAASFYSSDNGVAGGLVYCPGFNPDYDGFKYSLFGDFGYWHRYITNFTIDVELVPTNVANHVNFSQVSFTNYSYVLPNDVIFSFPEIAGNIINNPDFYDFDVTTFLGTAISGFLEFEIIPGISILTIFSVVVAIPLVIMILKFFAGG